MSTQITTSVADIDSQHYQAMFEALVLQKGSIAKAIVHEMEAGAPPSEIRQHIQGQFSLLVGDKARSDAAGGIRAELTLQRATIDMTVFPFLYMAQRDDILRGELAYLDQVEKPDAVQSMDVLEDLRARRVAIEACRTDLINVARMHVEQHVLRQALGIVTDADPHFSQDLSIACERAAHQADSFAREVSRGAPLQSALAAEILFERSGVAKPSNRIPAPRVEATSVPARRH